MPAIILHVLSAAPDPAPIPSIADWWRRHRDIASTYPASIDQAIAGGFSADRAGYAFASAYQAALHGLFPWLPEGALASLCVTEQGGGHPRKIAATLRPRDDGGLVLAGKKRWSTFAPDADYLLVAASTGTDETGRNRLRLVRVLSRSPGVSITPMPPTPFVPEIAHGEIQFNDVHVAEESVLEGDGYDRYVKPFRTVEDIHVFAAMLAYLLATARTRGWPRPLSEEIAALLVALRALSEEGPLKPEVHVTLAGVVRAGHRLIEECDKHWQQSADDTWARWQRDRALLGVAQGARVERIDAAWRALTST